MANRWDIPEWLEQEVRQRDTSCVYCGIDFTPSIVSTKSSASWEHIINDARIITLENIALCCRSCNASKGQKRLVDWLSSPYCLKKKISFETVAPIIKMAIENDR
ncbi:HNH endonuclease [Roseibium suaedae]|uniref:HNH endonuclease n=1 Tax=Roseibium suaedae TaxID=735517 RepID=A0A1M7P9H6_9HYPH|nr:HNH endonuclease [Roseibium suaedae]SHN12884.1 HNH endonuclease [Roseibium suaedae]